MTPATWRKLSQEGVGEHGPIGNGSLGFSSLASQGHILLLSLGLTRSKLKRFSVVMMSRKLSLESRISTPRNPSVMLVNRKERELAFTCARSKP